MDDNIIPPKTESHNFSDSVAIGSAAVSMVCYALAPTFFIRLAAAIIGAVLSAYLCYKSHFTKSFSRRLKHLVAVVTVVVVVGVATYQLLSQWKREHPPMIAATKDERRVAEPSNSVSPPIQNPVFVKPKKTLLVLPSRPLAVPVTPTQSQPQTPITNDHGIINNAPNMGDQEVIDARSYGVPKPLPEILGLEVSHIEAVPMPKSPVISDSMSAYEKEQKQQQWKQETLGRLSSPSIVFPGTKLTFHLSSAYANPVFAVTCAEICVPRMVWVIYSGSFTTNIPFQFLKNDTDPRIIYFATQMPMVTPDLKLMIDVGSTTARDPQIISFSVVSP